MSINQGRVGFRDGIRQSLAGQDEGCPSIRAASASATPPTRGDRGRFGVSINQGRVGFRDGDGPQRFDHPRVSINQGRVGFRDGPPWCTHRGPKSVHQSGPRRLPRRHGRRTAGRRRSVHQSGPRRLPRLFTEAQMKYVAEQCPSIRAASASATPYVDCPTRCRRCPSIRAASASATFTNRPVRPTDSVSINQGRVGFRDTSEDSSLGSALVCPSIRAASASATRAIMQNVIDCVVSINQGRVGFRDVHSLRTDLDFGECPSIRAASASATHTTSRPQTASMRVHQSGPRRLPRRSPHFRCRVGSPVSINQGRVGFRDGLGRYSAVAQASVSINQGRVGFRDAAGPGRLGWASACPSIRAASASATPTSRPLAWRTSSVHQSGPRRLPRPQLTVRLRVEDLVSINQGRVGFRDAASYALAQRQLKCPSIRAASASATMAG